MSFSHKREKPNKSVSPFLQAARLTPEDQENPAGKMEQYFSLHKCMKLKYFNDGQFPAHTRIPGLPCCPGAPISPGGPYFK